MLLKIFLMKKLNVLALTEKAFKKSEDKVAVTATN